MFLSFIIPVYNAEHYIVECLASLLNQDISKEDYEIICVNDGSKDNSLAILNRFAAKNPNLRIINKENGGVTTARNAGLDAATGTYIWFIDADDFIKPNCLSQLKSLAESSFCHRIVFGGYQFTDALTEDEQVQSQNNQLPVNTPWYDAVVWRSLLHKDFLQTHDLRFHYPELTHGEDGLFMYEVALCHPVTAELDEVLYFYREHSGSAETTVSTENRMRKLRSYILICKILYNSMEKTPTELGADKLMSFLWMALYEVTKLPTADARNALNLMKAEGLFPYHRPKLCSITHSYMTDRTDLIGKVFDKVYQNLHRPWGYAAMCVMQKLK